MHNHSIPDQQHQEQHQILLFRGQVLSEFLQISRANVSTLHRFKSKVLREGDHPSSISGHFGTVFTEEYVLRFKFIGALLWNDR